MSRPEKFSTASGEALYRWWFDSKLGLDASELLPLLRDEVAREVREECDKRSVALRTQADAWFAVCNLMDSIRPQWHGRKMSGQECMLAELRQMAEEAVRAEGSERERDGFKAWVERAEAALAAERAKTADAKREGAREALTRLQSWWADVESHNVGSWTVARNVASFREREYPAPAAPAGEQTRAKPCGYCAGKRAPDTPCVCDRPAPTPEPCDHPPIKVIAAFISPPTSRWQSGLVNVTEDGAWWGYAEASGEWSRFVPPMALGSRPTQTAEG